MNLASKLSSIIERSKLCLRQANNFEKLIIAFIILLGFLYSVAGLTRPLSCYSIIFLLIALFAAGITVLAIVFGILRKVIYGIVFITTKAIKDAKNSEKSDSKSTGLFSSIIIDLIILLVAIMIFCAAIAIFN